MSEQSRESTVIIERGSMPASQGITRLPAADPSSDTFGCTYPRRGGLAPWQVKRLTTYIGEHIGTRLRVGDLAELVRLSDSHFIRAFKVSFRETPGSYIRQQRMHRAQVLMLTTRHPLSRVALECGLCDQAHFSRTFRRIVGSSPRAWLRQIS
jgi:AraC-like DNA-binding protein